MIITAAELEAVQDALDKDRELLSAMDRADDPVLDVRTDHSAFPGFFAGAPHLVMPLGYDEYVVVNGTLRKWVPETVRQLQDRYGVPAEDFLYPRESLFCERASGAWFLFDGLLEAGLLSDAEALNFIGGGGERRRPTVRSWLARLETARTDPRSEAARIVAPRTLDA